jgi:heat-inducible transcriptional repressor
MRLATTTFSNLPGERAVYVEGAASLLEAHRDLTMETLHALVQMIEEKQRLVRLLSEYIDGPGITVVIGAEHQDPNFRPFSLIASTYEDAGGIGTVGVIGPTRMQYSRAIAMVDGAAEAVSRVLREQN